MESLGASGKDVGAAGSASTPLLKTCEVWTAILALISVLSATSCSTTPVTKADETWKVASPGPKTSALHTDPDFWKKAVTQVGQNESAVFSPDVRRILFISRDRLNHRQRQLYEFDLIAKTERRLTFQDGEVLEATYSPYDGRIFYTSSTDEMKEQPKLFYPDLDKGPFPRAELYSIKPEGELHERWTEFSGFDGFVHVHDDGTKNRVVTISRFINGELQLLRSSTTQPHFEPVLAKPGLWLHSFTSHPREGTRAWVEETPGTHSTKVQIARRGQNVQSLITRFFDVRGLHLWSGRDERGLSSALDKNDDLHLLLTGRLSAAGPRQAFWVQVAKNCYQTMDLGPGEIKGLDVSSDQKMLLWTLAQGSNAQVFMDTLARPEGICEPL